MATTATDNTRRGREADKPTEIPKKGWRDILLRVKAELGKDHIGLVAAGVAFFAIFAIFPALAALVSIYGLIFSPQDVERQVSSLTQILPPQAADILQQQLHSVVTQSQTGLGWGVALGIIVALWSASKGVKSLIKGLNIAYDEQEERGFIKLNGTALALTLVAMLAAIAALALIALLPVVFNFMGLSGWLQTTLSLLRWPILFGTALGVLVLFYRYGPSRDDAGWAWVSWGALAATVLWVVASILFSLYVTYFGSYSETYGSLGAVVVLMLWFYLTCYIALLGAEFNSEIEHQTRRDTTTGPSRPLGERGAHAADTVGRTPNE